MGRTALYLVIGVSVAFGIIAFNLDKSKDEAIKTQSNYIRYSIARNLARAAVHMQLRAIDRNDTAHVRSGSFNGGTYLDSMRVVGDTMWMTCIGNYENQSHTIRLKLYQGTKPFPGVTGALGIRVSGVNFKMNGNPAIDGHNYLADGSGVMGSGDKPGVTTMNTTDSASVKSIGGTRIGGVPPVIVDTNTSNPLNYVNEYLNNADYHYSSGTYSSVTWGSQTSPVIVVCETPDTLTSVKFTGNVEGWGILVVRGNLTLGGNFRFHGLVIVYGENNVVNASAAAGTPDIFGGVILAGAAGTSFDMRGNAAFGYSSQALDLAKNIGKLRYYTILDWYE